MDERGPFPVPDVTEIDSTEWWRACARGQYVMQRCVTCGAFRYPPKPICHRCRSQDHRWELLSGRGTVYSYAVVTHPAHADLARVVPYVVAVVELADADGERVVGRLLDADPGEVRIGAAVSVEFEDVSNGVGLPQWRLSE
jgi:uncharacterized protein